VGFNLLQLKRTLLCAVTAVLLTSCGGASDISNSKDAYQNEEALSESSITSTIYGEFIVDTAASVVKWEGTKWAGDHHGVVSVSNGIITVENGEVKLANITIDLTTISEKDTDAMLAAKLEKRLKAPVFFNIEQFPTANIYVTRVEAGLVDADLAIKGKTKSIQFPATITVSEKTVIVSAKFSINRTDFGIVYGSGNFFTDLAKDKIVNDEIDFNISIKASK
jgi:polyisoprenoid-binding protein YceI